MICIFPVISILPIIPILIYIIIATSAVELWYHSIFYYTKLKDWLFNHYWDLSIRTNIPSQCDFESITIGNSCSVTVSSFHFDGKILLKLLIIRSESCSTQTILLTCNPLFISYTMFSTIRIHSNRKMQFLWLLWSTSTMQPTSIAVYSHRFY